VKEILQKTNRLFSNSLSLFQLLAIRKGKRRNRGEKKKGGGKINLHEKQSVPTTSLSSKKRGEERGRGGKKSP